MQFEAVQKLVSSLDKLFYIQINRVDQMIFKTLGFSRLSVIHSDNSDLMYKQTLKAFRDAYGHDLSWDTGYCQF